MTQHPFECEFSEQEAAKLSAEQEAKDSEQELTNEEMEQVAGGSQLPFITKGITLGIQETGEGGVSEGLVESGGFES